MSKKAMLKNVYSFNQHRHNFAVWTSSRAVSRGFSKTDEIARSIEKSGLREFVESYNGIDKESFKKFHIECCKKIITSFKPKVCYYGIASKIIAIYLKTSLLIYNKGNNCSFIHPPIDRILLTQIIKSNKDFKYKYIPWTKLNENQYWDLIKILEHKFGNINWNIEYYWNPTSNKV